MDTADSVRRSMLWSAYGDAMGFITELASKSMVRHRIDGGGNGSVMRIQPHVWAAPVAAGFRRIGQHIVRNTIVTHGHPRAIVGACFHGLCLLHALHHGTLAALLDWKRFVGDLALIGDI